MIKIILIILIILAIYLLGIYLSYKHIKIAHSKKGIYDNMDVDYGDPFMIFSPGLNIAYGILLWIVFYPYKEEYPNLNKFFKIKK